MADLGSTWEGLRTPWSISRDSDDDVRFDGLKRRDELVVRAFGEVDAEDFESDADNDRQVSTPLCTDADVGACDRSEGA